MIWVTRTTIHWNAWKLVKNVWYSISKGILTHKTLILITKFSQTYDVLKISIQLAELKRTPKLKLFYSSSKQATCEFICFTFLPNKYRKTEISGNSRFFSQNFFSSIKYSRLLYTLSRIFLMFWFFLRYKFFCVPFHRREHTTFLRGLSYRLCNTAKSPSTL